MSRAASRSVLEQLESRTFLSALNDPFAGRLAITTLPATITDTNVDASAEAGEPAHHGFTAERSVWYSWTAPRAGVYRITTAGSDFDTVLAVYRGKSLDKLRPIAGDDDADRAAGSSIVTLRAPARATYLIAVDGYQGATGNITLSIAKATPLVVNGTSEDDIISVTADAANYVVDVNGQQTTYPISTVRSLRINAGAGNDRVSLGQRIINTSMYGGAGDDVLIGGDNADKIYGEDGNDEIYASFGNDTVDGGRGDDRIEGQFGTDSILGGDGADLIWGNDGDDYIRGGAGADTIDAGAGSDRVEARDRVIDTVDAGADTDRVRGDKTDLITNNESLLK